MTTSIHAWSVTAGDNDDADGSINWAELQDPDTVNNSARAMMARLKEWLLDIGKAHTSSGATDTYEITMDSSPTALVDGISVLVRPHQTNVSSSTLKINSFAAKPLRAKAATNLAAGEVQQDVVFMAVYNLAADEFLIHGSGHYANTLFPDLISNYVLNNIFPVGAVVPYSGTTVPSGWLECDGSSITTADYAELHAKIGYNYGGSGANFNIPDLRGEFLRGYDNAAANDPDAGSRTDRGDGTTGDAVGTKQADDTESHTHTGTTSSEADSTVLAYLNALTNTGGGSNAYSVNNVTGFTDELSMDGHTHSFTSDATGGNETRPRNVSVMFIIFAKPSAALVDMQGLTGLPYKFDDGTTDTDPGAGHLAWNNASIGSATEFYISETGPNSEAFGPILATWDDIGAGTKGYVYITKVGTPTTFVRFAITSNETDQGTYKKFTISGGTGQGTFSDGDNVNVIFTPVGAGATGDSGADAGVRWDFDTSTVMANPSAGDIRLNNAAFASVTAITVSAQSGSSGNPDVSDFVTTWDDSTSTGKGTLIVKGAIAPENFAIYELSAITDNTTHLELTVSHVASNGSFSASDQLSVSFCRSGDLGATGNTGLAGGIEYQFDSATDTASDPGAGDIRLNNATLASVTELAISYTGNASGPPDFEDFIKSWDDSTNTADYGQILIKEAADQSNFAIYSITSAITDGTTFGRFTVSHLDSGGSFSDADVLSIEFTRTGNKGTDGLGSGDVTAASNFGTDNRLIRSDGTAKGVQSSGITVDDSDNVSGIGNITLSGTVDGRDVATDGSKLDGVEALADVTDAANVAAAGAIMDGDFSSNGLMKRTGAGAYATAVAGTDYEAPNADILKADESDDLTVGYTSTPNNLGTLTTGTTTPDPANGQFQYATNGGAHTLAAPTATGSYSIILTYTNNASAGAITRTGFTVETGDTLTTTDGDDFELTIIKNNGFVSLHIKALQ